MDNIIFGDDIEIIEPLHYEHNYDSISYWFLLTLDIGEDLFIKTYSKDFILENFSHMRFNFQDIVLVNKLFNEELIIDEINDMHYINFKYVILGYGYIKSNKKIMINDYSQKNYSLIKTKNEKLNNLILEHDISHKIQTFIDLDFLTANYNLFSFKKLYYSILIFEDKFIDNEYINYIKIYNNNGIYNNLVLYYNTAFEYIKPDQSNDTIFMSLYDINYTTENVTIDSYIVFNLYHKSYLNIVFN